MGRGIDGVGENLNKTAWSGPSLRLGKLLIKLHGAGVGETLYNIAWGGALLEMEKLLIKLYRVGPR